MMYQTHHFKHEPVYRDLIHDPKQYMLINIDAFVLMASSVCCLRCAHAPGPMQCMMPQLERSSFDFFCTLDVFTISA
jgi:hypothetical protein